MKHLQWKKTISLLMVFVFAVIACACAWGMYQGDRRRRDEAQYVLHDSPESGRLRQLLGEPITIGWFVRGKIPACCDYDTFDLLIPVSGTRASGILRPRGRESFAGMHVCALSFTPKEGPRMVLIPDDRNCHEEPIGTPSDTGDSSDFR